MSDMFSPSHVTHDTDDIALVVEVTLPQISSWLLNRFEDPPEHVLQHIRDPDLLKEGLAPLYDEMQAGDSLWLCRSRVGGGPHGHEGVALVRDGRAVVYVKVVQY